MVRGTKAILMCHLEHLADVIILCYKLCVVYVGIYEVLLNIVHHVICLVYECVWYFWNVI